MGPVAQLRCKEVSKPVILPESPPRLHEAIEGLWLLIPSMA